jgi:hypothetical protein
LSAKSKIYIDVLVLSEFINTYSRTQWKFVARHIESFKAFRNSSHFKPVAQEIGDNWFIGSPGCDVRVPLSEIGHEPDLAKVCQFGLKA